MSAGTARRAVRVDNELWAAFLAAAESQGDDASAVLRRYMRRYVNRVAGLQPVDPNSTAARLVRQLD